MNTRSIIIFLSGALGIILAGCGTTPAGNDNLTLDSKEAAVYLEKGKSIASATFTTLSTRLQAAMQEGGVANAIEYCNLNAYPLVDSLSKANNAVIRRTTTKTRNPKNNPSATEQSVLTAFAETTAAGGELQPVVKLLGQESVAFFAPIRVNAFCLQCHGKVGESLKTEDYAVIQEHYPQDAAVGYTEGDLRGMWSIQFKRQ